MRELSSPDCDDRLLRSRAVSRERGPETHLRGNQEIFSRPDDFCEIVNGQGMRVLPRAVPVPSVPFARYYGLLSRAPERRSPETETDGP